MGQLGSQISQLRSQMGQFRAQMGQLWAQNGQLWAQIGQLGAQMGQPCSAEDLSEDIGPVSDIYQIVSYPVLSATVLYNQ